MSNEQRRQAVEMLLSWGRVFLAAAIALYGSGVTAPQALWNAGLAAVIPVILRWLDPMDKTYGRSGE